MYRKRTDNNTFTVHFKAKGEWFSLPTKLKNDPMSPSEMMAFGGEKKRSKLYREASAELSNQQISDIVERTADELSHSRSKVDLRDTEHVKALTYDYLKSCAATSTIPSIAGLSRALGMSRTAFYLALNRGTPADTAAWFELCHDAFSDALAQASLRGAVQPVVSIFLQKALFGFTEKVELIASTKDTDPLGVQVSQAELEAKLGDVVLDDE